MEHRNEPDPPPAVRLVTGLPRMEAPAELDALVEQAALDAAPAGRWLRRIERVSAPAVLDRLVAEELERPAAGLAERFVGDLPRRQPLGLTARIRASFEGRQAPERSSRAIQSRIGRTETGSGTSENSILQQRSLPWGRTALAGLAAAACALLLLRPAWDAQRSESPSFRYPFTLVEDARQLEPLSVRLGDSMSAGLLGQGLLSPSSR